MLTFVFSISFVNHQITKIFKPFQLIFILMLEKNIFPNKVQHIKNVTFNCQTKI